VVHSNTYLSLPPAASTRRAPCASDLTAGCTCPWARVATLVEERDPRRAALLRARPDGTEAHLYATGLRNTVGFDWRPGANELYGTDNGRDFLGDDAPPCELNRIELGQFYGWPYANGGRIPDPDFGKDHEDRVRASAAPVHTFGAHTSSLGISFISGKGFTQGLSGRGACGPAWVVEPDRESRLRGSLTAL
jgi:glucose/arabinose dehydrogenase